MIDPSHGEVEWSRLLVAGKPSPGQVRLSGPGLVIGWDVKNADGQSGGSTTRTSEPIKEFEAEFDLTNEEDDFGFTDFDRWDDFEALLKSSIAGAKPQALEVYHPDLARVGITAVVLRSIGMMTLDGTGGAKVTASFIEHRPPKPKPAAGASKTNTQAQPKTAGDKQIDAAIAEIEKLQKEWETL